MWHSLIPPVTAVLDVESKIQLNVKVFKPNPKKSKGLIQANSRQQGDTRSAGAGGQNRIKSPKIDDLAESEC